MRTVSTATTTAWNQAVKAGSGSRAMVRATIERLQVGLTPYDMSKVADKVTGSTIISHKRSASGSVASAVFCWNEKPVELPNIKSFSWTRAIDQDIATAKMTLWNTQALPLGTVPTNAYEWDIPGALSFNRGVTTESQTRWGHSTNGWRNLIAPDRLVRTWEGYGLNASVPPDQDAHMYPSGVWLIDRVVYTSNGLINLEMRDLARLLADHICFPPVVPESEYPLSFSRYRYLTEPVVYTSGSWFRPAYNDDSNRYWYRAGKPGVTKTGGVSGHYGRHAFDGDRNSYWMSLNNAITHGHGWVEARMSPRTVGAVKVKPWNGPYSLFISLYANGKWQGRDIIHGHDGDPNIGEQVPTVLHKICKKNTETVFQLPKQYTNVTKVRVSIIHDGKYGGDGQHVGIYDVQVTDFVTKRTGGGKYIDGNYGDYTDVVKWFAAWGGFFWGRTAGQKYNRQTSTDGSQVVISPLTDDPIFPQGRVWGDFESTGTGGIVDLTVDQFDKKPLLDCIAVIREIIGFNFFVDETGGVVWRSPNIWTVGNYLSNQTGGPNLGRTSTIIDIPDDATMINLSVTLDSQNVRERTFVASTSGNIAGTAKGIFSELSGPFESGMRRVGGWTDQNFETSQECQIMADLITVRSMFTYRTTEVTICGNPAIQIDDQVHLLERTTSETYLHYVKGITSDWDAQTGVWTYKLSTHWLGEAPFAKWVFDPSQLSADTQAYLRAIGKI